MPIITLQINHTDFTKDPSYVATADRTAIPNNLISDRNLSGASLSLLLYLLTQSDASIANDQKIKILIKTEYAKKKALKILIHFGYLSIERTNRSTHIWHVYDTPQNEIQQDIHVSSMGGK